MLYCTEGLTTQYLMAGQCREKGMDAVLHQGPHKSEHHGRARPCNMDGCCSAPRASPLSTLWQGKAMEQLGMLFRTGGSQLSTSWLGRVMEQG